MFESRTPVRTESHMWNDISTYISTHVCTDTNTKDRVYSTHIGILNHWKIMSQNEEYYGKVITICCHRSKFQLAINEQFSRLETINCCGYCDSIILFVGTGQNVNDKQYLSLLLWYIQLYRNVYVING